MDHITDPASAASSCRSITELDETVTECFACPRLVQWREDVAATKRAAFRDQTYWGRPVPGFGPADAAIAIVGLAPAAHGANRTGRMFTGDRSGDVLYDALYRVGMANQPVATWRDDGLRLHGVRITAPVRCAPPANRPSTVERDTCRSWLVRELRLLRPSLRVVVVLGGFGWQALLPALVHAGAWTLERPRPKFGHREHAVLPAVDGGADLHLLGCYHVSQQNTFTGRLTPAMLEDVLAEAGRLAELG